MEEVLEVPQSAPDQGKGLSAHPQRRDKFNCVFTESDLNRMQNMYNYRARDLEYYDDFEAILEKRKTLKEIQGVNHILAKSQKMGMVDTLKFKYNRYKTEKM